MKRKVCLTLIIAVIVSCILCFSVSAKAPVEYKLDLRSKFYSYNYDLNFYEWSSASSTWYTPSDYTDRYLPLNFTTTCGAYPVNPFPALSMDYKYKMSFFVRSDSSFFKNNLNVSKCTATINGTEPVYYVSRYVPGSSDHMYFEFTIDPRNVVNIKSIQIDLDFSVPVPGLWFGVSPIVLTEIDPSQQAVDDILNAGGSYTPPNNNGELGNSANQLEGAMGGLDTDVDLGEAFGKVNPNDLIVGNNNAFTFIKTTFTNLIERSGFTQVLFFSLVFGLACFVLGKKLRGSG